MVFFCQKAMFFVLKHPILQLFIFFVENILLDFQLIATRAFLFLLF